MSLERQAEIITADMSTVMEDLAKEITHLLIDHKASKPVLIDIGALSSWTRYFVIATAQSSGHLRGLMKELGAYLDEKGYHFDHKQKTVSENGWELLDCGDIVIHLMSQEMREFYDLENLWHKGQRLIG